jgi:hypothetical protein
LITVPPLGDIVFVPCHSHRVIEVYKQLPQTRAGSERQRGWHHARMAEADQLGPLSSGLSRAWSLPLVATVTSDIVDVLKLGKPPPWCVPSTKVYVKRFSMPAGALVAAPVGARFHPAQARCQRLDSHCLRAHCTIKHPRVSTDHLVRQTILHRHDDFPPRNPTLRSG